MSQPDDPPPAAPDRASHLAACAGAVVGVLAFWALVHLRGDFAANELGLGLNTSSVEAFDDQGRVSGYAQHAPELGQRARGERALGNDVVLWLGASQLHAINELAPGDQLAVGHANARASAREARQRHLQLSLPNANLAELLQLYEAFRASAGEAPQTIVLALVYDDLQEQGLREGVRLLQRLRPAEAQSPPPEPAASPPSSPVTQPVEDPEGRTPDEGPTPTASPTPPPSESAPIERSATAGTPQAWLEDHLVAGLEAGWPGYSKRSNLRSWLIASWKEPLTRALFSLRGRPGASVDPTRQTGNMAALERLIALARGEGVRLLIYKQPHRPGEVPFYHPRQAYDEFFTQLEARCQREGVGYLDLETLVPAELWGLTNNYLPDVFHFRDEGHQLLGQALDDWIAAQAGE